MAVAGDAGLRASGAEAGAGGAGCRLGLEEVVGVGVRREVDAAFSPAEPGAAPAGGGWERMGPPKELWWRSRDEEDAPLGSWSSSIGVGAACILEVVVDGEVGVAIEERETPGAGAGERMIGVGESVGGGGGQIGQIGEKPDAAVYAEAGGG